MSASNTNPRIKRLDEVTVNRIAAGEIIHRPANALKELLENSLDAGSTAIQIILKEGGLKLLQIQDNGHGINKDDLSIVCERFTTSKLSKYEDLNKIATYGFRGEALASISHIAHLSITTRTVDSFCSWRACYSDGKLVSAKPGGSVDPKPCAGNVGTLISAEDLFHNVPIRRKSLNNTNEEYNRVLEVVQRYAIHNNNVSFTCKKQNAQISDLQTPSSASKLDNIRTVFGNTVARELLEFTVDSARWEFKASGYISNANFNMKKFHLLLFINHRLVENHNIKKSLEALYSKYLPKRTHPFAYISLEIKPQNLDVNVHPTKRIVQFLHEDSIIEVLCDAADSLLAEANNSRTTLNVGVPTFSNDLASQSSLGKALGVNQPVLSACSETVPTLTTPSKPQESKRPPEHKFVRTDNRVRTLDEYIQHTPSGILESAGSSQKASEFGDDVPLSHDLALSFSKRPKLNPTSNSGAAYRSDTALTEADSHLNKCTTVEVQDSIESASDDAFENTPLIQLQQDKKVKQSFSTSSNSNALISSSFDIAASKINLSGSTDKVDRTRTDAAGNDETDMSITSQKEVPIPDRQFVDVRLTSVLELRNEVIETEHKSVTELFHEHTFVGCVNDTLALIQHHTKLYLINYQEISRELFYQLVLRGFSNFGSIHLDTPLSLTELALIALDEGDCWDDSMLSKSDIAANVADTLCLQREMLQEYFSIGISLDGCLVSLPVLMRGEYLPNLDYLPEFILRLGGHVSWDAEKACFKSIAEEISVFYSVKAPFVDQQADHSKSTLDNKTEHDAPVVHTLTAMFHSSTDSHMVQHRHMIEHVLFPAIKRYLIGTKRFLNEKLLSQIADLPDLYRIFERC
ncbi:DNA mismatch repair protein Mlh1 [Batrachochytrium dendrobatidis]